MLNKFTRLITFVDLPIKKKFTLFSLSVLFWFVVMFVISIAANININNKTGGSVREVTTLTFYIFTGVLLIATALLVIFTISISKAIARPVNLITGQIRALGEGKVDFTKKIDISSEDEIGALSKSFNTLMDEIHDLNTFKKVIEEDDNIEDVYSRLGRAFSDKIGLNEFIIYEVSNGQKMRPVYPIILNDKDIFCSEEILHNCELCKVKKTGHIISSVEYPDICRQFIPGLDKLHVCIPMIIGGKTGGVVQFLFDKKNYSVDGKDRRLFKAERYIKESLSVIEAKRLTNTLRESALKDSLTGLYNRRFLQEYTETLVAGVLRRQKSVGLMMCDLDFFKQVNDFYGHNVGDSVLKETSEIIKKCVRSSDLVIRFGGEEFLVLMLDINAGETVKVADKIRDAVEKTKIKVSDGVIKKTISLGVSEFPVDTESFWQAIKFADVALYKAKETGRNRVVRFHETMWTAKEF
ncbi:MAG: sensor domain-containing diguanylate cyclase [Nitrospirae bacterium]|nr:sensor domain-containing diguanylate cyclase [Nitrospirota bacterium]